MDLGPPSIELRRANAGDSDLVERVLLLAANWLEGREPFVLADFNPAYWAAWGKPDDLGVFAFDGPWFAGGAYARRVGPADGTWGFVDAGLWELTIAIEPDHRGNGLGRLVLEALKAQVIERGIGGLSLSTELDNSVARALYEAANFNTVEERATDVVMAWRSPIAPSPPPGTE